MILTVNLGNTHITIGGYEHDDLKFCGRLHTDPAATEKRGWDPTDPDPANPWDDAFESGTAIRSQAAWDQWETERKNWMSSLTPTDLQGWSTDSKIAGTRG